MFQAFQSCPSSQPSELVQHPTNQPKKKRKRKKKRKKKGTRHLKNIREKKKGNRLCNKVVGYLSSIDGHGSKTRGNGHLQNSERQEREVQEIKEGDGIAGVERDVYIKGDIL